MHDRSAGAIALRTYDPVGRLFYSFDGLRPAVRATRMGTGHERVVAWVVLVAPIIAFSEVLVGADLGQGGREAGGKDEEDGQELHVGQSLDSWV